MILTLLLFLFPVIEETIPDGPFSYPGISMREEIYVDPQHSPLLEKAYEIIVSQLHETHTEREILQIVSLHVRETLFNLDLCHQKDVAHLVQKLYPYEERPSISLETFLEEKIGVCRHTALTTTYLVDRLIKEGWLKGQALLIRENIPTERHAWTLFLSETGAWHLDALWGILENGKTRAGFFRLCQKYGKRPMDRQKLRWQHAD